MTEQEWLTCADPMAMLECLRGKASERKLRLFACACCRRLWLHEPFCNCVGAAERYADGLITKEEMSEARSAAIPEFIKLHNGNDEAPGAALSAAAIPAPKKTFFNQLLDAFSDPWWEDELDEGDPHGPAIVTVRHAAWAAAHAKGQRPLSGSTGELEEQREQAGLLRCIFGNLFRPVAADPARLTMGVVEFAQAIYDRRAFDRVPRLADELEKAGCISADILNHCRQPGPHVRGCWVVDAVLGKA